jgi:hypothetical protein
VKKDGILFVHIPRTGGTHFEKLLGFEGHNYPPRCGSAAYGANREEIMGWDKNLKIMLTHATYEEMIKHSLVSLNEKLTNVSIVRNPYHRTVSLFNYFGGHEKWGNFKSFLKILKEDLSLTKYFYLPQYKYLTYKGEVAIENLIKFENYILDAEKFKSKYGLRLNVTFNTEMQIKKSKNNLNKFYNHKNNLSEVEEIYQKDFELFGYNYGDF